VLQAPVFILQPFQLLCVADFHAAESGLPRIDRRRAHADLPSQFGHFPPRFMLLQDADDLLFAKSPSEKVVKDRLKALLAS